MSDSRYAVRQLLKHPGFTAVAVLTLALGLGANTVIFSAVNAILLRPPPYREPERLVWLFTGNSRLGYDRLPPNWANETFSELLEQTRSLDQAAKMRAKEFVWQRGDGSEPVRGMRVSFNLFRLLGVQPVLGRAFHAEENEWGRHHVVLISHACWQRRFGGDPDIIGQTANLIDTELSDRDGAPHDTLDPQPYTVIGVLPAGWRFPVGATPEGDVIGIHHDAEFWEPESLSPAERQHKAVLDNIIARLQPGVTLAQARAELQNLFRRLRAPREGADPGYTLEVLPLVQQARGSAPATLLRLMAATGLVLLISCANLANLLLARATARRKEFAIRAAVGAPRTRIIRQLITEAVVLSLAGGALGWLLAFGGTRVASKLGPAYLPRLDEITMDAGVFGFALGLSLLTGIIFGVAPAVQASRARLSEALGGGSWSTAGPGAQRLRGSLVISEVALSLVLLVGASLFIQSFIRLLEVDLGFQAEGVWTRPLSFRHPKYRSNDVALRLDELLPRVRALPGVEAVSVNSWLPIAGGSSRFAMAFQIEGRPAPPPGRPEGLTIANMSFITPGYFRAMGIPLLKGRDFQPADLLPGAASVKVVSQNFVRKFLPGKEPLGARVAGGEIIGVVADTREAGLDLPPEPHLYHAGIHTGPLGLRGATVIVRSQGEAPDLAAALEREIAAWDQDQPTLGATPLSRIVSASLAPRSFQTQLMGAFAGIALLLAAAGIYGVMAYQVAQRTQEIGVRLALGARQSDVLRLVLGQGLRLILIGIVIGLVAALVLLRGFSSLLFAVTAADPVTYAGGTLVLVLVGMLACWLPARRAARVDPASTLRSAG